MLAYVNQTKCFLADQLIAQCMCHANSSVDVSVMSSSIWPAVLISPAKLWTQQVAANMLDHDHICAVSSALLAKIHGKSEHG